MVAEVALPFAVLIRGGFVGRRRRKEDAVAVEGEDRGWKESGVGDGVGVVRGYEGVVGWGMMEGEVGVQDGILSGGVGSFQVWI